MTEKAAWRPRRFDVAGAHPDEAFRAVSYIAEAVEDLRKQFIGGPESGAVNGKIWPWRSHKPMRFDNPRDGDVQQFLERGVKLMDDLKQKMPLGLSRSQELVRNRSDELAKSMAKVLAKRPDEALRFDPKLARWREVRIDTEACPMKSDDLWVLSGEDMRLYYVRGLNHAFPGGPSGAARAQRAYGAWEGKAERLGNNPPMPDAAKPWQRFLEDMEKVRMYGQTERGEVWGMVDTATIDFRPALQFRQFYQSKPKMRM